MVTVIDIRFLIDSLRHVSIRFLPAFPIDESGLFGTYGTRLRGKCIRSRDSAISLFVLADREQPDMDRPARPCGTIANEPDPCDVT